MKKNVFAIFVLVSVVALFASCNYKYNKDKMRADKMQALEEGDEAKATQLETRIEQMMETDVTAMTVINDVVEYFTYKLNVDRMLDDLEQAQNEGNDKQKEYLLDRLMKLKEDPNSDMTGEQEERLEEFIGIKDYSEEVVTSVSINIEEDEENYDDEYWN